MNPAAFAAPATPACTLGPQGSGADDFGPDRITRNLYDDAGQLLRVEQAFGVTVAGGFPATQEQLVAAYTYSPNGRRTSLTDGNGNRAEMTYDRFDRQQRWIFPSPTVAGSANQADYEEYGYDAAGNRTSLRKRDGSVLTYQYDALDRMTAKIVPERAGLSAAQTRDVYYGYDLRDAQLYARFDSPSGEGVTNIYDGFGRLASTRVDLGGVARTLGYGYDPAGNRTRITHPDGQHFDYRYDALSRFVGLKENGDSDVVSQFYHPTGERYLIGRGGAATRFLYDGDALVAEYNASGTLLRRYVPERDQAHARVRGHVRSREDRSCAAGGNPRRGATLGFRFRRWAATRLRKLHRARNNSFLRGANRDILRAK
jgi:YD repeat-containing protein